MYNFTLQQKQFNSSHRFCKGLQQQRDVDKDNIRPCRQGEGYFV